MSSSSGWIAEARALLDSLEERESGNLDIAAEWCASAIADGGLVHLFGSGHSRIPAEEMFPRYGSYPGFHPMVELSMTFHTEVVGTNSQPAAMFIERTEGLADVILSGFDFGQSDVMIVFSSSGRSAVPVEMAAGARERGLKVIGVTSVAESMASPSGREDGLRLLDLADLVIDIGTPPGDALMTLEGLPTPIGPGSTIGNVAVVNEIKVRVAELLIAADAMPPVLTAESIVGGEESRRLFDAAYRDHSGRLAALIDRSDSTR